MLAPYHSAATALLAAPLLIVPVKQQRVMVSSERSFSPDVLSRDEGFVDFFRVTPGDRVLAS
ncbi:hypothetical protein, partial [Streptomyces tendae]|uniref:hypothetical protein n=1 Tax=Streptomyces tendae TaxID=1932 RepID=UPI00371C1CDE